MGKAGTDGAKGGTRKAKAAAGPSRPGPMVSGSDPSPLGAVVAPIKAAIPWHVELVEDARDVWRYSSARLMILGATLAPLWESMPADLKANFPAGFLKWFSWAIFVLGLIGRYTQIRRKGKGGENGTSSSG